MKTISENIIIDKTFRFALNIVEYTEKLEINKKFVVANQLLKSGTSVGANVRESQNAESKADFIHKMKIALKETEETQYWLDICQASKNYPNCQDLIEEINTIKLILSKIVGTSKRNLTN
jgi:four helix bundle protein